MIFEYKKKEQIRAYRYCAKCILDGFYQSKRFYVLPFLPKRFRDRIVYFPQVDDFNINFSKYAGIPIDKPLPQKIQESIQKSIDKTDTFDHINYLEKAKDFIEGKFGALEQLLAENSLEIDKLTIIVRPVVVSSIGSYYFEDNTIFLNPRFDRQPKDIAKLLLSAIVHRSMLPGYLKNSPDNKLVKENVWNLRQKVSTFLFSTKEFGKLFGSSKGVETILDSAYSGKLAIQSTEYLNILKNPVTASIDKIEDLSALSNKEKEIVGKLKTSKNKIVPFDKLAEIMWREDVDRNYSLYAITKAIERIRTKLTEMSIPNVIHTQRGAGYVLYD
ncbi:MAG: helix-turn-helix domain-containing protein [Patescibacteria group bacterium]|nr:helix-turn-helix domain-containing protein [Patescibacteria group bacterium]